MSNNQSENKIKQNPWPEKNESWALALSGGGIRSATFSLGVVRGLAKNGVFRKFNYISTVSGGGYIGATLGRLYQEDQNADQVEKGLAADDTTLLKWLRRNGRYLEPAGAWDILQAAASQLRGFITSQIEAGMLLVGVALIAVAPSVTWNSDTPACFWLWWAMTGLMLFCSMFAIVGYWAQANTAIQRLRWTNLLAILMMLTLAFCGLGALQQASYSIANFLAESSPIKSPVSLLPPGMLFFLILARKQIKHKNSKIKLAKISIQQCLQCLGFVMLVFIVLAWATLIQLLFHYLPTLPLGHFSVQHTLPAWLTLAAITLIAINCSRHAGLESLNLSSLHNFYRARLERAYISVGNYKSAGQSKEGLRFEESPLKPATDSKLLMRLNEASGADDIPISHYLPQRYGGPIHLINCTINQTVDDRTGRYNADRKGVALTISANGYEVGTGRPHTLPPEWASNGLSRWTAISGAAVSTGLGSLTSTGLAILMFLGNIRLGYWIKSPPPEADGKAKPATFSKIKGVCAELFGHFPGLQSSAWYLSDGGHFENTAVYALIKRKCRVIIVTDVGADLNYEYEDLSNLVRKSRIDYNAQIDFIEQTGIPQFGSLTTLKAKPDHAQLLIGKIIYSDGSLGTLIVAKPHQFKNWPLDLHEYAKSDPEFPQNTTLDQFFSESQWEAYHQLGLSLGRLLDPTLIQEAINLTTNGQSAQSNHL